MGSTHEQQLRNPRYRDWVKAGLALKYLKDGIQEFVDDAVKDQQRFILEEVRKEIVRSDATCKECPIDILLPAHPRGSCGLGPRCFCHKTQQSRRPCPSNICGRIFDRIVQQHMHGRPSWGNTDSTKWCTSHWEIAKCFLDGGGYGDKVSAANTDCKGLLSVVTNNMFIQKSVDAPIDKIEPKTDVFSKTKEARNEILHLASLELPDGKLDDYVDVMIQLLGDKGKLHEHEQAKQAISALKQLKEKNLNISTEDEWEIRESALKAIQEKKQDALDEIDEKQREMFEKLQIGQLQDTLSELSKTTEEATQSLSNRQESLSNRQESLSNRQESLSTRQESLEQRQALLEKTVEQIQELQSESSKQIGDLHQALSDLKTRLNSSDEVELLHKKKLAYLKRKKDLKDELSCLYSKHLSTIPVPPLLKKLDLRVDEFYMELEICEDQEYESKSNKDSKQAGKNIVRSYKDIFYKEKKRVENIYVLGDAGVGKSTWCLKLIDTWLKANKPEGKSTNETSLNEKLMLQFEVVLFVSLRHASKEKDLIDMIRNQIFLQTPDLLVDTQEVLKAEPEKCLVIIDGLDEWNPPDEQMSSPLGQDPSFPGRKDMNHCTVLTTTRPWKLDEIRPSHSVIDRAVVITGFESSDNIQNFAAIVINKLNQKASHEIASYERKNVTGFKMEVIKRFRTSDLCCFPDLMKIPLIVIFMVLKWFKDGSLESTMAGNYSSLLENMLEHEEGYRNLQPRYGQKRKYDGRLSSVPYLEQAKVKWSEEVDMLPDCIKKRAICKQYSGLILKLSKIAFEGLFEKKGNSLIFIEEVLLKSLSPEELEVSVKSGLLSKTNDIGGPSIGISKFSFLHKTVQEYMSAIYLVAHESDNESKPFQILEKYCITYQKIYEMENVILFVCGLSTGVAKKILKHVSNVEHSRMCFNKHDKFPFYRFCSWIKEIREATAGLSMPVVPINSVHCPSLYPVDAFVDEFLRTNADNIKYISSHSFSFYNPVVKIYVFPNLTTLKLAGVSIQCSSTGTNFQLKNLRNLSLSNITCTQDGTNNSFYCNKDKFVKIMLDFSASINIEKVKIDYIDSLELLFSGSKLKKLEFEDVKSCLVRVHADTAVQKSEHKSKVSSREAGESKSSHDCVNQRINCINIQRCVNFELHLHSSTEEAINITESVQVSSLHCQGKSVEVHPNILIESVSLIKTNTIPNIPWQKVKNVVLNQLPTRNMYVDILKRLHFSQSLMSLHCVPYPFTEELENTLKLARKVETLEITCDKENCNTLNIHEIKHLKLQGEGIHFLANINSSISNFNKVESLQLSNICPGFNFYIDCCLSGERVIDEEEFCRSLLYLQRHSGISEFPKNALRSLVNLKCLQCYGFTEYDFRMLGECFQDLPHLQELELSLFMWEKDVPSRFFCLENIKNLKILSLVHLSPRVMFAVMYAVTVKIPSLGFKIEELKINHCFLDAKSSTRSLEIMSSLQHLETLKKVTVIEEYCFTALISTIQNLKQIESVTLVWKNCKYNVLFKRIYQENKLKCMIPLIKICKLSRLKTLVLKGLKVFDINWKAFVKCLPTDSQLQTVELQDAEISKEEKEQLLKVYCSLC